MLVTDAVKAFLKYLEAQNKSGETVAGYGKDLRIFNQYLEEQYNGLVYIDEITENDLEDYICFLKEVRKLKPSSQNRYFSSIRSFFNYATRKKLLKQNIAQNVENVRYQRKEREYLSKEELEDLFDVIEHPIIKVAIITMAYTGIRVGELTKLTPDRVDLEKQLIKVLGKGNKERTIPISEKLLPILIDYAENIRFEEARHFFGTKKTGRLSAQYINNSLRLASKKIGLKQSISAHILRHSFATVLVHNDVNIVDLQRLLGHNSIRTTSIYLHTNHERLKEAVNSW
ncbi:tyrosine-type recombinase/integrase [Ureibacillus xyleni]|nr:tyrosine-type recombinase/integrase [Ureibacillus xyleni]